MQKRGKRRRGSMAAYGIPEADIARMVGVDPKTLRKHYRDELDLSAVKANAQVAGFLFNSARNGNVTAQIFWLKPGARWKWRRASITSRLPSLTAMSGTSTPKPSSGLCKVSPSTGPTPNSLFTALRGTVMTICRRRSRQTNEAHASFEDVRQAGLRSSSQHAAIQARAVPDRKVPV